MGKVVVQAAMAEVGVATVVGDTGVLRAKDFCRNGRNTRFWLVALRWKDFGIKTLTIDHQTQSISIKLKKCLKRHVKEIAWSMP
jgi:hypothetical protein